MIRNQLRFFLQCEGEPEVQFFPVNSEINFQWKKDDKLKAWRYEMTTELCIKNTLIKDGYDSDNFTYDILYNLERQCLICPDCKIRIQEYCNGVWIDAWKGYLPFRKGEWDKDKCQAKLKPRPDDVFRCLDDVKKNLLDIEDRVIISTIQGEVVCETISTRSGSIPPPPPGQGWTITQQIIETWVNQIFPEDTFIDKWTVTYCRECLSTIPADPSGWSLEGGKYYRPLAVQCESTFSYSTVDVNQGGSQSDSYLITTETINCEYIDFQADNAITLQSAFQFLAEGCGIPICSDFFGINPIGDAPNNSEYQCAMQDLQNIVLFQASDIILADASNNATKFEKSFCDLWQSFSDRYALEMFHDEVNNCIRLEHETFPIEGPALDLTHPKLIDCITGNRNYTYSDSNFPLREEFKDKIETTKEDFNGAYFEYPIECSTDDINLRDNDTKDECAITDVAEIYNNEAEYGESLDVLKSMVPIALDSQGNIISGAGYISGLSCLNNPLSWSYAIAKFHQNNRPVAYGDMSGNQTAFASTRATRESPELTFCLPCEYWNTFRPRNFVITPDGKAIVKSVSRSLPTGLVTLTVCHSCT